MKKPLQLKNIFNNVFQYSTKVWSFIFVLLILVGILLPLGFHFDVRFDLLKFSKENKVVELYTLIWNIIVSLTAVILYLKRNGDDNSDYLVQNIEVVENENYSKIRTSLYNKTSFNRHIESAFLIITPEGKGLLEVVNENFSADFEVTNNFFVLKGFKKVIKDDFAFIPLDYYSQENIHVGNEELVFEIGLDNSKINKDLFKFYNVRFFVFRPSTDSNPYHRSVSAVFASSSSLSKILNNQIKFN
jgi:hypothetical protein